MLCCKHGIAAEGGEAGNALGVDGGVVIFVAAQVVAECERGSCWVAVGRRSFFGSRSRRGADVAALFYSLAECARRVGVETRAYFRVDLAAALAGQTVPLPHELLPALTSA